MPGHDLKSIKVKKVAGGAGAEIHNVDLHALDDATIGEIREAFLDNGVVFFRNQDLTPPEFLRFSEQFGTPVEYPFVKGIDGYPEIIQVLKRENEKVNFGGVWHSDTAYLDEPPMGTMLMAQELPPYGGDTIWSNQYAAYEALSDGLKGTLNGLRCCQSSAKADASNTREDRLKDLGEDDIKNYVVYHPVVRTHPETSRKALFCNIAHTTHFEGWTEEESQPLLQYLFQHQIKPEFTCRFKWESGSIAFWDNRCVQHYPINDYHGYRRLMYRITLAGDVPK
jgi:taurine dioxygenase